MLSIDEARARVSEQPRVARTLAAIEYGNVYLVRVEFKDPAEASYDPFYSVDKENGAVNEFSFLHDGDPYDIMMRFLAAEEDDFEHSDIVDKVLAHHGVKGMKWGVINEDDTGGAPSGAAKDPKKQPKGDVEVPKTTKKAAAPESTTSKSSSAEKTSSAKTSAVLAGNKKWSEIPEPKHTTSELKKNYADSHAKFIKKVEPSNAESPGKTKTPLTPEQKKKIAKGIVAGVVIGGYVALAVYGTKKMNDDMLKQAMGETDPRSPAGIFKMAVANSKKTWSTGYITQLSHDRPEFELPIGHVFHRISTGAENSFKDATYATHSIEDFNRYVTAFRGEKIGAAAFHHVTFEATSPIKVPNLKTTLDTLHEVMASDGLGAPTQAEVLNTYKRLSGSSWDSYDHGPKLFEALAKKGYGAIVDEMDANVIGESPIVLFAKENVSSKVSTLMSNRDIVEAEKAVTDFANRK